MLFYAPCYIMYTANIKILYGGNEMRSDIIHVTSKGAGMAEALAQAEAVAVYKGLKEKQALQLRLLTEEMMGMLRGLTGENSADFFIEDEDCSFKLHLKTETQMTDEKRKALLSTATSGKNAAAQGVMGKIRDLYERAFEPINDKIPASYVSGWIPAAADCAAVDPALYSLWSFNRFRENLAKEPEKTEEWDELERSIVANIADEIQIGIRSSSVELVIYKKF